MSSPDKAKLIDTIQALVAKGSWKAAIDEMEKLFDLEPDPIIRVRIGDAHPAPPVVAPPESGLRWIAVDRLAPEQAGSLGSGRAALVRGVPVG